MVVSTRVLNYEKNMEIFSSTVHSRAARVLRGQVALLTILLIRGAGNALVFLGHPASIYKMSEVNNKEPAYQGQTLLCFLAFVKVIHLQ